MRSTLCCCTARSRLARSSIWPRTKTICCSKGAMSAASSGAGGTMSKLMTRSPRWARLRVTYVPRKPEPPVIIMADMALFLYSYKTCGGEGDDFDGGEQVGDSE